MELLHRSFAMRNESKLPAETASRDPFAMLRAEIDHVFEGFGRRMPGFGWASEGFTPKLDIAEADHALTVTAELPGVDPKGVELTVEGDLLTIKGEKTEEKRDEQGEKRVYERAYGAFARSVRLPFAPDPDAVTASFDKGVLTLAMPIPAEKRAGARKIEIRNA
jgi:HSP20 family protein